MSYGLGAASYDVRNKSETVLHPSEGRLLSTIEYFNLPDNVRGMVLDKSTYARNFVTSFNTFLDPGWQGYLTVEMVNLGRDTIIVPEGAPLVQIEFAWLDGCTDQPYRGKYYMQPNRAVEAILEEDIALVVPYKKCTHHRITKKCYECEKEKEKELVVPFKSK
jgi:dCTP deaminase